MRKKAKGFTVLELIITLSLTVVVLGVVYTFFFSNSKTLAKTEINSDLQLESEAIQKELLLYGTQAKGISKLNNVTIKDTNKYNYEGSIDDNGKLEVEELRFKIGEEYFTFIYDKRNNKLTLKKVNKDGDEVTDS
ncbi:prepilin-type N-terminal cleavage/methylation domain-containing protein, partial [Clostridium sp.]